MENTKSKASNNGETGDLENAVNKAKGPPSAAVMKKEKRQSRFNISRNQELEMLPPLRVIGHRYAYLQYIRSVFD
nr:unnamed protein product [Callosobruchus chinensis]